jgi:hypothetical protein
VSTTEAKENQMTDTTFEVFCPGVLEVLSIGKGDMKLSVGDSDDDRARARTLITEMLEKGYLIYVEGPDFAQQRVKGFDPDRLEYIITDIANPDIEPESAGAETPPPKPTRKKKADKRVPVKGTMATAVGRTAGG